MRCTEGFVLDTHFYADKISPSKRRISLRASNHANINNKKDGSRKRRKIVKYIHQYLIQNVRIILFFISRGQIYAAL